MFKNISILGYMENSGILTMLNIFDGYKIMIDIRVSSTLFSYRS